MDTARLFSAVCSDRTRSNGLKLKHKKFHRNMQKYFFKIRVMEQWNRLPREIMESPSMETFKTHLDAYLCDLLQGTCFSRGLGSVISIGPFQPLRFSDLHTAPFLQSDAIRMDCIGVIPSGPTAKMVYANFWGQRGWQRCKLNPSCWLRYLK